MAGGRTAVIAIAGDARATWLYMNRSEETVRLAVRQVGSCFELTVAGPGRRRATYDFADAIALIQFQGVIENRLLRQGYALEHFARERRTVGDRRAYPRPADRERRRR